MISVRSSTGFGRYAAGEWDISLGTNRGWMGYLPPLVYCHGAGDGAISAYSEGYQRNLVHRLAQKHMVVVCDLGGPYTWGNDTLITRIQQARDWLASEYNATGPITLVGTSMGGCSILNFARAHPDQVVSVAAIVPALDLWDIHENRGMAASIDAAYGGVYSNTVNGPTHNPVLFANTLPTDLPVAIWTASDDAVCVPATADAFMAARPQTTRTDVGALGHTGAAIGAATDGVVAFSEAHSA